jgi:hypothetical protein
VDAGEDGDPQEQRRESHQSQDRYVDVHLCTPIASG